MNNDNIPSDFQIKLSVMQLLSHTGDIDKIKEAYEWMIEGMTMIEEDAPEGSVSFLTPVE